ncbi:beta-lactamase/transpeptidase-like protein [Heliocybe sulcata]|uniref:Beta-lactamase/transpeptidase-like protein n=1 Tax=Heliocybe sulcata TaxID=5364 RepID=A0A5C3MKX2_9AGAM|nr:beta-lactamase/transpeptidase-like protein [Heliocybe sulcata]
MRLDKSLPELTGEVQAALDEATAAGIATGFQYVIFTRDTLIFNGVSGYATMPTADHLDGVPYQPDHAPQLASCGKIVLCLIVLHILERGLTKQGFTLEDLDNPQAVTEVLPEFASDSGHLVSKVIEGFEEVGGERGRKAMKLRDPKTQVTLRMLFTHTAGLAYFLNDSRLAELYRPSDGKQSLRTLPFLTGNISDLDVPLVAEPGQAWNYGHAIDWLAQFAIRSTGKNLRDLMHDVILAPLDLSLNEVDIWDGPAFSQRTVPIYSRNPERDPHDRTSWFQPIPVHMYSEPEPSEGKATYVGASMYASAQSYAKVLQAVMRKDERILSPAGWSLAYSDGMEPLGLRGLENGLSFKAAMPTFTHDVPRFVEPAREDTVETMNLLNSALETGPTASGRPAGSFGWAGIANSYYFIDPVNGIGALLTTQLMPFFDPQIVETRDRLEKIIYDNLDCLRGPKYSSLDVISQ